jgi:hypothetical protein
VGTNAGFMVGAGIALGCYFIATGLGDIGDAIRRLAEAWKARP